METLLMLSGDAGLWLAIGNAFHTIPTGLTTGLQTKVTALRMRHRTILATFGKFLKFIKLQKNLLSITLSVVLHTPHKFVQKSPQTVWTSPD